MSPVRTVFFAAIGCALVGCATDDQEASDVDTPREAYRQDDGPGFWGALGGILAGLTSGPAVYGQPQPSWNGGYDRPNNAFPTGPGMISTPVSGGASASCLSAPKLYSAPRRTRSATWGGC